jgi:alpha-beta hydrolase superfamily lysophospholipase
MGMLRANGSTRLLDLRVLNASLPVPPQRAPGVPILVMGAAEDAVVDQARLRLQRCFVRRSSRSVVLQEGVRETAAACGAPPPLLLPGIGHDVMLDAAWESAAAALAAWLDALPAAQRK